MFAVDSESKSHAALAVQALFQLASDPDDWPLLLDVIEKAPELTPERERELSELVSGAARIAELAGARDTPENPHHRAAVIPLSRSGQMLAANDATSPAVLVSLGFQDSTIDPANLQILRDARRRIETAEGPVIVKLASGEADDPRFVYALEASRLSAAHAVTLPVKSDIPGALALIVPSHQALDEFWSGLRESFGLTPAEIRLASLLKDGLSVKEAAIELDVSVNTARNQLSSVFAKLGLNRQSDLVRSLTQLSSLSNAMREQAEPGRAWAKVREPLPPLQFFTLPDGRRSFWREYGRADGSAAMLFHAGFGASLLPSGTDRLCKRLGMRLVVPERAGMGHSDPDPQLSFGSVAQDTEALAVKLGLESFPVVAMNSGARFGIASAIGMKNRVTRILLVSARIPPSPEKLKEDTDNPMVRFQRRITGSQWMMEPVLAIMRSRLSRPLVARILNASATSRLDAVYLRERPELIDLVVESLKESLSVSAKGTADEMKCLRRSMEPDLTPLRAPVTVWHGVEDTYVSPEDVSSWLGSHMSELRVMPDIGNYLLHKYWTEIIRWLARANA